MKKIVVIYWSDDWHKDVPISAEATRLAFQEMQAEGLKVGLDFYRASWKWLDLKTGLFEKAWNFRDGLWHKIAGPIKPDMIFDKLKGQRDFETFDSKMELSKKVRIYNSPVFRVNFDNKFAQYLILSNFMPKTVLIESRSQLELAFDGIKSKQVVVKPVYGSGGFGIYIGDKNLSKIPDEGYPLIAQEFIDGSGIPDFTPKGALADLRMIYMNDKLLYSLSRVAKKGSLFTNFHQGAVPVLVPEESIPESAKNLAAEINKKMVLFKDANYSLDFIFDKSGEPLLVEVNTTPGFDLLRFVGGPKLAKKYLMELKEVING
jgi:glutathione synthase/RimK-type ligase-like ATP-grasp enzyme